MPDVAGLSRRAKYALIILEESRHPGVLTVGRSQMCDGQPWIHYRTAYALQDRGLAYVTGHGEEAEVHLGSHPTPEEGR